METSGLPADMVKVRIVKVPEQQFLHMGGHPASGTADTAVSEVCGKHGHLGCGDHASACHFL